jgi:ribosomal protein S18 acetylase RimI-like enzyme
VPKLVVTIQDISADDLPELLAMHAKSWRDTYPNDVAGVSYEWVYERTEKWLTPDNIEKRKEDARSVISDPNALWKVAKDEKDTILGFIRAVRKDGTQYLGALYVDEKYHGKDVAKRLMDAFLAWENPAIPTTLDVTTYNDRAKAFYKKYGFKELEGSGKLHHEVMPIITMIRKGGEL